MWGRVSRAWFDSESALRAARMEVHMEAVLSRPRLEERQGTAGPLRVRRLAELWAVQEDPVPGLGDGVLELVQPLVRHY